MPEQPFVTARQVDATEPEPEIMPTVSSRWRHCCECEVKWYGTPICWVCGRDVGGGFASVTLTGAMHRQFADWESEGGLVL